MLFRSFTPSFASGFLSTPCPLDLSRFASYDYALTEPQAKDARPERPSGAEGIVARSTSGNPSRISTSTKSRISLIPNDFNPTRISTSKSANVLLKTKDFKSTRITVYANFDRNPCRYNTSAKGAFFRGRVTAYPPRFSHLSGPHPPWWLRTEWSRCASVERIQPKVKVLVSALMMF